MIEKIKEGFANHTKNILGTKLKRKIVVFAIDDYGNLRLASEEARENMKKAGLKIRNRYDELDTLENKADLTALYETLSSVKDSTGRPAVFTAFALPCNLDFEKIAASDYTEFHYELLPQTFAKMPGYEGTMDMWKEGIKNRLLVPQSHGREHLNLKVFKEKLAARDEEVITALKNHSYTCISKSGYSSISYTAEFDFWDVKENEGFEEIIRTGLDAFEQVFGFRSVHFNPPGGREHPSIHKFLKANGIKYLDVPSSKKEHQGHGKFKTIYNYMGKKNAIGQTMLIRNGVFEPNVKKRTDWVGYSMAQIDAAFKWGKPAILSSHRVNYAGLIDEKNRTESLATTKKLLQQIMKRWPDVEFMTSNEVGDLIAAS